MGQDRLLSIPDQGTISTPEGHCFGFQDQLHLYPKHEILDVAVNIPSPQVLGFLPEAGILRPNFYAAPSFGRDDAPLKLNILAFYFRALAPLTGP